MLGGLVGPGPGLAPHVAGSGRASPRWRTAELEVVGVAVELGRAAARASPPSLVVLERLGLAAVARLVVLEALGATLRPSSTWARVRRGRGPRRAGDRQGVRAGGRCCARRPRPRGARALGVPRRAAGGGPRRRAPRPSEPHPLEVAGFGGLALAERLTLHAFAVEPGRPRGRVVGLERWSTGRGNVAAVGVLVVLEVVASASWCSRVARRERWASARVRWWPSSSASASCPRARRGVLAEVVVGRGRRRALKGRAVELARASPASSPCLVVAVGLEPGEPPAWPCASCRWGG